MGGARNENDTQRKLARLIFQNANEITRMPSTEIFPAAKIEIFIDPQELIELFDDLSQNVSTYLDLESSAILPQPLKNIQSSLQTLPNAQEDTPAQLSIHSIVRLKRRLLQKRKDLGFYLPQRVDTLKKLLQQQRISLSPVTDNQTSQNFSLGCDDQELTHTLGLGSRDEGTENKLQNLVKRLSQQKFHPGENFTPKAPQPLKEIEFITTFPDDSIFSSHDIVVGLQKHQALLERVLGTIGQEFSPAQRIPVRYFRPDLR